jgi:hypothetical protein
MSIIKHIPTNTTKQNIAIPNQVVGDTLIPKVYPLNRRHPKSLALTQELTNPPRGLSAAKGYH